jgi:hypothetical protein
LYVLDSQDTKLYATYNGGSTWTDLSANLPLGGTQGTTQNYNFSQSGYDYYLGCGNRVVDGKNTDILFLSEIDIQQSADQGKTWQSIGGPSWLEPSQGGITHNDQHCFALCPTNPNLFLFGNDGGIYSLSYNTTKSDYTVTALNSNLSATMFYKLACHPTNPNIVMGGTQDNGTPLSPGDLGNWVNPGNGDGGSCVINQANPLISYLSSEGLDIWRTSDGWKSSGGMSPPIPKSEHAPFVCSMVLDPNNQYTMYTGTNYMWKYDENTGNWSGDLGAQTLTNGNGRGNVINAIAVAPTDSNTIYTGSGDAGLFMTTNGGQSWRNLDQPIKLQINAINVSPAKANDFLVGFNGSGQPHLFHGVVTSGSLAFTPVSGSGSSGLPDASLNAIARDLDDPQNTWYVGTDVGVFMTTDAGASWSNAGTAFGLPPGIVNDLVAVPGTRYLNAGTYGRGLWRLYFPGNNAELQSLTVSPNPLVNRTSTTGTVTLNNPAPLGGMTLQLSGDNTLSFPSTVVVPYEVTTATFPITSSPTQTAVVSHITATEGSVSKTVAITVEPLGVQSLNAAPNDLVGGRESGGTVYLDGNAPSGGLTVKLSSNQASVKVPATIKIAAGTNAASFSITTVPVDRTINATITATTGEMTASTHVTVEAPSLVGMSIAPTLFVGGSATKVTGTLTFNGPSVAAGIPIQLTSSNPSAASVPATVTAIPTAANLAATFTVDHYVVQTGQSAVITASAQGQNSQTVTLGVLPFFLTGISVSPNSVVGGASSTGTVTLDGAPRLGRGDILVKLSTNSSAVTIPATVKVLDGKSSATFPITTKPVGATTLATITGAYGGITQTAQLTVQAPTLTKLSLSPTTIIGGRGHDVTATLVLNGVAPPGGVTVVCDGSPNSIISMPFLVTIPAGYTSTTFKITTAKVLDAATCTVYAQLGTTQLTATVKVEG